MPLEQCLTFVAFVANIVRTGVGEGRSRSAVDNSAQSGQHVSYPLRAGHVGLVAHVCVDIQPDAGTDTQMRPWLSTNLRRSRLLGVRLITARLETLQGVVTDPVANLTRAQVGRRYRLQWKPS